MLLTSTPLLFTGLAVAIAFRAGFWNIGAEGQFLAGAVAADLGRHHLRRAARPRRHPARDRRRRAAGALWVLVPALLRVRSASTRWSPRCCSTRWRCCWCRACCNGPWRNPVSQFPESPHIGAGFGSRWSCPGTRVHLGFALAVGLAGARVARRHAHGRPACACARSASAPHAARFAGIGVERTLLGVGPRQRRHRRPRPASARCRAPAPADRRDLGRLRLHGHRRRDAGGAHAARRRAGRRCCSATSASAPSPRRAVLQVPAADGPGRHRDAAAGDRRPARAAALSAVRHRRRRPAATEASREEVRHDRHLADLPPPRSSVPRRSSTAPPARS